MSNRLPKPRPPLPPRTLALARGLGWFSVGLGAVELLAPKTVAKAVGLRGFGPLVASYGAREVAAGAGILLRSDPTIGIWSRVGGDALDIATLAVAFAGRDGRKAGPVLALLAVAGVTLLDVLCARELSNAKAEPPRPVRDYSDRSGFPNGHPRQARA